MMDVNRRAVSVGRAKVHGSTYGFHFLALALTFGLQILETAAIQFNQLAIAYGLGFAVIAAAGLQ